MIRVETVLENRLWKKKIKKSDIFFNDIIKNLPKKYQFINKKVSLAILLSNNKSIKKLNKNFKKKIKLLIFYLFLLTKNHLEKKRFI